MNDIITAKLLAQEALLSYQKFLVKNVGTFSMKDATIVISNFTKIPRIKLIIDKKVTYLPGSHCCRISSHPKHEGRFFITIDGWSKEFYSMESAKIIKVFNLALQYASENID